MPQISVIIPIYNVEKYIHQCMYSIINQTLKDIEIICVDDFGTDKSMDIVSEFAEHDNRIKIVKHAKNSGLSSARNTGLKLSTAPYIMFLDSDDYYETDMCKKMLEAIINSDSDIAVCGTNIIYEINREWKESDDQYYKIKFEGKENINENILQSIDVSAWNKIYRKSIIEAFDIRFPDGLKYEDAYFFNAYMAQAKSVYFVNEKLYNYRRREGSIMNETFNKKSSDSIHHLKIAVFLYEYYKKHNLLEENYEHFAKLFLQYYNFAMFHAAGKKDKKEINLLASSFAKKELEDTSYLPFDIRRQIELVKNAKKFRIGSLIKIKETFQNKKIYVLGIPVYKIKYNPGYSKHYLFGIHLYRKKMYKQIDISLDDKNFHPFTVDNKNLIAKLKNMGNFTYIPNPGNMGDMLIAAATLQFFDRNMLSYTMWNGRCQPQIIVYGGGGIWTKDYENAWAKFLPFFNKAQKIIILPSSFYNCSKFIEQLDERFVVFCREKQSYNYLMKAKTKAEILLDHDMAFRLDNSVFQGRHIVLGDYELQIIRRLRAARKKMLSVGYFLRKDCESIHNYPTDCDLSSLCYGSETVSKEYIMFCAMVMLCVVDSVATIITDRLHVGIAGVLMGKETYLLDNSYKKVSNVYYHTLKHNKLAHLTEKIPQDIKQKACTSDNLEKLYKAVL